MSTDRELLEYARQALQNENSLRLGYTTRKGGPIESIAKDAIERIDAALAAPAAGLSWSGHNISGDAESIRVVKDALHDAGNMPELKDEIARLRAALPAPLSDELIEKVHQETGLLGGGQEWVHRFAREMFKRGQATTPATALPVAWRWSASHSKAPEDRAWKEGPPPAAHESRLEIAYAPGSVAWRSMDSAPLDGTEVLIRVRLRAGMPGRCLVGHFIPGGHCIEDHPAVDRGWFFWNGCMFDKAAEPESWLPLPDAVPGTEPGAWLFKTQQPGRCTEWASIDPDDSSWWPMDQGYTAVTRTPLAEVGEAENILPEKYVGKKWTGPRGFAGEAPPVERGGTTVDQHQTEAEHKLAVELGFTPGAHDATILMLNAAVRIRRLRSGGAPKDGA